MNQLDGNSSQGLKLSIKSSQFIVELNWNRTAGAPRYLVESGKSSLKEENVILVFRCIKEFCKIVQHIVRNNQVYWEIIQCEQNLADTTNNIKRPSGLHLILKMIRDKMENLGGETENYKKEWREGLELNITVPEINSTEGLTADLT